MAHSLPTQRRMLQNAACEWILCRAFLLAPINSDQLTFQWRKFRSMKKLYTVTLTLAVVIGLVSMASAQDRRREITRREAARIQRDRAETRDDVRRARA